MLIFPSVKTHIQSICFHKQMILIHQAKGNEIPENCSGKNEWVILQHQPKYPLFNTDRRTHKGDRVETGMGVRVLGFLRVWENLDFEENGREELWELMEKEGNKWR